jgi:hypothetical protein
MVTAYDRGLTNRMIRAAQLQESLYEEVERDRGATGQAAQVVLIAAVAGAIATLISSPSARGILAAIVSVILGLIGWVIWSYLTYWVGTTFFKTEQTRVTPGEMLRTIGFSHAPGVLRIFTFIPVLGALIALVVGIWQLVAGVIAVRAAMDFDTGRAIATVVVGWIIQFIVTVVLFGILLAV